MPDLPVAVPEAEQGLTSSSARVVLRINDLNKNITANRVAFFACLILLYIGISMAFYSGFEEMSILDAVYYAIITMATVQAVADAVGYGDKKPETLEGRLFAIFFVLLGFSILAYGFSLAASFALEKAESMKAKHESRVDRLMNKVADIRLSVSFSNLRKRLSSKRGGNVSKEASIDMGDIQLQKNSSIDSSENDDEDNSMLKDIENSSSSYSSVSQLSEAYRKSFEYETYKLKRRCVRNLCLISTFMFVASMAMMAQEGWTVSDSLYWAVVTITTVGYGDYTPQTNGGKVITIIYVLLGCVSMASVWSEIIKYPLMVKFKRNELAVITQFDENVSAQSLKSIGRSRLFANVTNLKRTPVDEMSKIEFVLGLLELMGKVRMGDVTLASTMFDRLDSNADGVISSEEMAAVMQNLNSRETEEKKGDVESGNVVHTAVSY